MTPARAYTHPDAEDISLARVLHALSDPIRLEMLRRLAETDEANSLDLADDLPRSTLTYHTRILRETGVTWTRGAGRACLISLRRDDLDALFPGLLPSILDSLAMQAPDGDAL